jgi:hypothetical protein
MIIAVLLAALLAQASPEPSPTTATPTQLDQLTPEQRAAVEAHIIKETQNPVGNITVVPFQNNFNYALGPYARFQYNLNVQPVIPIMLSRQLNLISRTIFPLLVQPSSLPPSLCASADCGSTFGLSDIQEQLFFAPKTKPDALIWGAGPIFQFPTAQPQTLGSAKWSAGPDVVVLKMPGRWVFGILATQLWSFAGRGDEPNVNQGLFQPFVNYNMPGGWAVASAPIITANYNAPGNPKWAVPIGGGITKTFKAGDQLMQLSLFYYSYVQKPLSSPQTNLRIVWALVFPVKRGVDIQELIHEVTK